MRRAFAIIGVILMLAVALFIRSRGDASRQAAADEKAKATLYCAQELGKVCDALKLNDRNLTVVTEEASRTLASVTDKSFDRTKTPFDGWLAPQPYIDLANENRTRAGLDPLFGSTSRVLARSPIVVVGSAERLKALAAKCGGQFNWKCAGENAGRQWSDLGGNATWGSFGPVVPDPSTSATGLLSAAEATGSYFGNSSFATNDFSNPGFSDWRDQLAGSKPRKPIVGAQSPLQLFLSSNPVVTAMDMTTAMEAQAIPSVADSRDKDRLSILYPSPLATADVVLAPMSGSEPGGRLKDVLESDDAARAFAQNGWRVNGQPLAAGLNPNQALPDGSGLPKPGVLQSLAGQWQAAR